MTDIYPIHGYCAPGYEAVRDAFIDNFTREEEIGAGFCAMRDGVAVVDLYGGYADRKKTRNWERDTIVPVFSSTKAVAAIVIAHLADADKLSYNQKVASLWPDFAQNGKGEITVGDVLSHQAGLSGISDPSWQPADWMDWDKTCAKLAAQAPIWPLGNVAGYHPVTYGYLVGEIAKRADGRSLGTILREDICAPHDIDFHIGLPDSEHERCADLIKPRKPADLGEINDATRLAFIEKWSSSVGSRSLEAWRRAEIPSTNGHGTAAGLARIMQILVDGKLGGEVYLSEDMLRDAKTVRVSGPNLVLPFDLQGCAGVFKNEPNFFYGPNPNTVGHSGWGGSCVFADAKEGLSAAYIMNRQSHHLMGDPRTLRLIEALYGCL